MKEHSATEEKGLEKDKKKKMQSVQRRILGTEKGKGVWKKGLR